MTFVEKTRYKTDVEDKDVKTAVTEAIDECVEENILVDFFEKHREEVVEVSIYDYDRGSQNGCSQRYGCRYG